MTSVSVVLATYNGERYLPRQLESLAWQTRLPDELIIKDDGSSDETLAIARRFAAEAEFAVRVIANDTRENYVRNFMGGVALAAGDIVMFCDQDDIWHPDKIAVMTALFDDDPALLLAYHQATAVDADERPIGPVGDIDAERRMLAGIAPPWHFARGLLQAFRRELTRFDDLWPGTRAHINGEPIAHDRWYFALASALGGVAIVDRNLLDYRQHGSNAYGADLREGFFARLASRLRHHGDSDGYEAAGATSLARVFDAMVPRVAAGQRASVEAWADRYRAFGDRLARRHETYAATTVARRGRALLTSLRRRDYAGNPWGFDPRSIVRDLWSGVWKGA